MRSLMRRPMCFFATSVLHRQTLKRTLDTIALCDGPNEDSVPGFGASCLALGCWVSRAAYTGDTYWRSNAGLQAFRKRRTGDVLGLFGTPFTGDDDDVD